MKMVLVSAVALIDKDNRVLLAKRPEGKAMAGLWEFPGGKVEAGETPEAALVRELQEELGIEVRIGEFICESEYQYPHIHIRLLVRLSEKWPKTIYY